MPEIENNIMGNIDAVKEGEIFGIKASDSPFAETFYFSDYYDDKKVKQFIKSVEKLIRTSVEYKTYIELLRTNIFALNHDSIMSNITTADVDLEFHHYPFSLYELIECCILQHIYKNENFTSFSLAKEIMEEHFKNNIGLVPLTKTTHELAHSGNLFLSSKQVFGNYHKFMEEHKNGLTAEIVEKINTMERRTADNIPTDFKGLVK